MQPYPGRIGGEVGGNIRICKVKSCRLKLTLSCVLVKPRFDGDGNDNEAIVWLNKLDADFNPEVNGTSLRFRFDVPAGLPPSGRPQLRGGYHLWRLDIESLDLAVQFAREYRIPVFGVY